MIPLGALSAFANFLARPAAIIGRAQEVDWDDALDELDDDHDETGRVTVLQLAVVACAAALVACVVVVVIAPFLRGV